ncbi:hypothetical protein PAE2222a [Pyrobaculum aerophilum str. IM2]|uniref:PaREP2a n=1 Tax=Pyrobaculum aerophilum (strain ATCC 51768 / DSM 7523 / JCM 9630 / CIP 104966 / NBRC 100827 / IM2) TaxID=178306 RepID=Q8ZVL7_PYRAE|nr:hypothetical protein PAE2222a [Pyrobaculum aerophilum str. IM2]
MPVSCLITEKWKFSAGRSAYGVYIRPESPLHQVVRINDK